MINALIGDFLPYLILAGGAIVAFFAREHHVKKKAIRDTKRDLKTDAVNEYIRNLKEIEHAEADNADPDAARDRLRKRASRHSTPDN